MIGPSRLDCGSPILRSAKACKSLHPNTSLELKLDSNRGQAQRSGRSRDAGGSDHVHRICLEGKG